MGETDWRYFLSKEKPGSRESSFLNVDFSSIKVGELGCFTWPAMLPTIAMLPSMASLIVLCNVALLVL